MAPALDDHTRCAPTSKVCVTCHDGYAVTQAGDTCWTCHAPGQDMSVARPGRHVTCTSCHSPSPSTVLGGTGPHHVKSTPAVASLQVAAALGPRVLAGRTNRHTVQRESGGVWKTRMTAEARIAAAGEVPWVPQTVT